MKTIFDVYLPFGFAVALRKAFRVRGDRVFDVYRSRMFHSFNLIVWKYVFTIVRA